ncbi:MAG TPA: hypothetical protein VJ227_01580 [Patescibacteria group bacterium]|nr:hypothetical protein [Patescibacteria group bacterium]
MAKEIDNLPERVGVKDAVRLNRDLWRKRDRHVAASSPVEIPHGLVKPVFERVIDKFGKYVTGRKTEDPIVGFSLMPESYFSWEGYYRPDYGKNQYSQMFCEFGTEWLTQSVFGRDPFRDNVYLPVLNRMVENGRFSTFEVVFLWGFLDAVKNKRVSYNSVTEMFARLILKGDKKMIEELRVGERDGYSVGYSEVLESLVREEEPFMEVLALNKEMIAQLRSKLFYGQTRLQWTRLKRGVVGQSIIPGVINTVAVPPSPLIIAHEYIHFLSFHQKDVAGVPIRGYKLASTIIK